MMTMIPILEEITSTDLTAIMPLIPLDVPENPVSLVPGDLNVETNVQAPVSDEADAEIHDIYPKTPTTGLKRKKYDSHLAHVFPVSRVAGVVGINELFIRKLLPLAKSGVTLAEVLLLLDLDAFSETFVPRSMIPEYLLTTDEVPHGDTITASEGHLLLQGCAKDLISRLQPGSIQCTVTSTPYWGMRLYNDPAAVSWADGERCIFGNEQTPEGFIRHTVELLYLLKPALTETGSAWWNLMDTYNTRTQIRQNAAETLYAMQGKDQRGWLDYDCRRYSAGHSYLKDGEQCGIPAKVAERASRIGYYVKSMISWSKDQSMPETVGSRVTREVEYIIHLSVNRTPLFNKDMYSSLSSHLGGRNPEKESGKLTDVWALSTSMGRDGHGAQFPLALPGRCIALSTNPGDVVLDPFVGSGTSIMASAFLQRRGIGFDISSTYIATANERMKIVADAISKDGGAEIKPAKKVASKPQKQAQPQLFPSQ